jgi:hypothetical protein
MTNWWDHLFDGTTTFAHLLFEAIPGGTAVYDWGAASVLYLVNSLGGLLVALLYFPISMLNVVVQLLNHIIASLGGLMNAIIDVGNSLSGMFTQTFTGVFPSAWVAILGTILTINIALRVYYFAKDISILGFKI